MALIMSVGGRKRKLAAPCEHQRGGMASMGQVGALVVGAPRGLPRGHLYRQGMAGMGAAAPKVNWADAVTGGGFTDISRKLDRVELALKLSTAGALLSAALSVLLSMRRK